LRFCDTGACHLSCQGFGRDVIQHLARGTVP
jgi:hypothetical protein